jgi:hypothetical protein
LAASSFNLTVCFGHLRDRRHYNASHGCVTCRRESTGATCSASAAPASCGGGGPAGVPALAPQPTTYLDLYLDPNKDLYCGNYVNLYQGYSPGANNPQDIRNSLYRDGNTGAFVNLLVHVREPTADPDDPGRIVAYHRLTRKDTIFGQPPAPYENVGLAFFGDLVNGQAPPTVTIPDAFFTTLPITQALTPGHLQQLIAAQPDVAVFGPFAAGDTRGQDHQAKMALAPAGQLHSGTEHLQLW